MSESHKNSFNPDIINRIQELPPGLGTQEKDKKSNPILNKLQHMLSHSLFGRVTEYPESRVMVATKSPPSMVYQAMARILNPEDAKEEIARKRRRDRIEVLQGVAIPLDEQGVIPDQFRRGRVGDMEFGWIRSEKDAHVYVIEVWSPEGVVKTRREYLVHAENYSGLFREASEIKKLLVR